LRKIILHITLLLSFCQASVAQQLNVNATQFQFDDMGYIYLVSDRHLEKINLQGEVLFRTSDLPFGDITYLDTTNPLKPFVFFKDQSKIVVYDNTLSRQGDPIDLFELDLGQIECVGGSRGDAYWLWDSENSELIRVDNQFRKLYSTGNLAILLNRKIQPNQLLERGDHLYFNDPVYGILVFDLFGQYQSTMPVQSTSRIDSWDNHVAYVFENEITVLWSDGITQTHLPAMNSLVDDFQYYSGQIYTLSNNILAPVIIRK
jgi:hypothetical protein